MARKQAEEDAKKQRYAQPVPQAKIVSDDLPKVIASFQLPYKVVKDKKTGQFKVSLVIPKHAILYGSLLQIQKQQNFKWVGVLQSAEEYLPEDKAAIS